MKIGFIGVGGIAGNYLSSLQKLGQSVHAVCDISMQRAQQVASEHNAQAFDDYRVMLRENLDVVFVAIPPGAHTTQVADVARANVNVFVAKPVALELATVREAARAIGEAGVINQAGYMARYSDITARAKELANGRQLSLGAGRFMCNMGTGHAWWGKEALCGGQILEQATHNFDLLRYFLGDVAAVWAAGHFGGNEDIADFHDSTTSTLTFANGAAGSVLATCCANVPDGFVTEFIGRDFYLRLSHDLHLTGSVDGQDVSYQGEEAGYFRQVEEFLRAVEARDQTLVKSSYEDAAKSLAVTIAATKSLRSGQVERVEEIL